MYRRQAQAREFGRTRRTAEYQLLKARILAAQQDYKGAIVLLQNAVDQADNRSEALYLLAMAQLRTGKDADARTTANEFLKPKDAIYPAMLWTSLGEPDSALRYFQLLGPDDLARLRETSPALWQEFRRLMADLETVSYTNLRAHENVLDIVCRLLLEKKKKPTLQHN